MSDDQETPPPRPMSFRSPSYISDLDGYILAIILRLVVVKKAYHQRDRDDGVSVLTLANMEDVAPPFAYFKHRMAAENVRTREDLDVLVGNWGGIDIERWMSDHPQEIAVARKQLGELFDAPGRAGFSCYDG